MVTNFVITLSISAFGLISGRIEGSIITAPKVFVMLGLLVGRWGLAILPHDIDTPLVDTLATITPTLVLFTDAAGSTSSGCVDSMICLCVFWALVYR